jgi:hypothetical protein
MPLVDLHVQRWNDVVASDPNLMAVRLMGSEPCDIRYVGSGGNASTFAREPSIVATRRNLLWRHLGRRCRRSVRAGDRRARRHPRFSCTTRRASHRDRPKPTEAYWHNGGSIHGGPTETFEIRDGRLVRTAGVYSQFDLPLLSGRHSHDGVRTRRRPVAREDAHGHHGSSNGWTSR